jgi:imidazole glycerol phosphate synthase glutamine amidotransferase subunit
MNHLTNNGWIEPLNQWKNDNKLLLGICVGMQIMFEESDEDPGIKGLGWLQGRVEKLNFPKQPMVGWAPLKTTELIAGTPYFVNSYAIRKAKQCIATTHYGETFCAAVRQNNLIGFQFHPEKSGQYGNRLLSTVLNIE